LFIKSDIDIDPALIAGKKMAAPMFRKTTTVVVKSEMPLWFFGGISIMGGK